MVSPGTLSNLVFLSSDRPADRVAIHVFSGSNSLVRGSISLKRICHDEPTKFFGSNSVYSIGYADGLQRSLSNQGRAFFDGKAVPLVGRVSMDLTTFDVTEAPGVVPGAWLEIIGPAQTPDDLAIAAATNGYEVLTSLGRRFHRIYQSA